MTTDCVARTWKLKQSYSGVNVDVLDIFCLSKKLRNTPQLAIFDILNRVPQFFFFLHSVWKNSVITVIVY